MQATPRRGLWIALALCGVMSALSFLRASGVVASPHSSTAVPDVTVLFARALKVARSSRAFSRAAVLEADGISRGGSCSPAECFGGSATTSASGVVAWRFVFQNQTKGSRYASATLAYGPPPNGFGSLVGHVPPFVQDVVIPRAPKMTLGEAIALMRRAGYRQPFADVTLRNPLGPTRSDPLYIFGSANNTFVGVDTRTRKVARLS